jgi:hypothetical protein
MTIKKKKERTKEILFNLEEKLKKIELPLNKKGELDILAFNDLPIVRKESAKLKAMKITRHFLFDYGFSKAALVLSLGEEMKKTSLSLSSKNVLI